MSPTDDFITAHLWGDGLVVVKEAVTTRGISGRRGGGSLKASLQIKNQLESLHTSGDQAMHFNAQAHS